MQIDSHQHQAHRIPPETHIIHVSDPALYSKVLAFRARIYRDHYPAITNPDAPDIYDFASHYFTTVNVAGEVTSCSRLVLDSPQGLPSEPYVQPYVEDYRQRGVLLAELGRMAVDEDLPGVVIAHFTHALHEARRLGVQEMVFVAPWQKRAFFTKYLGAELVCADIQQTFGSGKTFAVYLWHTQTPSERVTRKLFKLN
mgnify:CR=1 FL=1|jgi:hypothetical protein